MTTSTKMSARKSPPKGCSKSTPSRCSGFRLFLLMATVRQPHPRERRVIFKNVDRPGWSNDISAYLADGGYAELRKALTMKRAEIVDEVKTSQLRGRGCAGFG